MNAQPTAAANALVWGRGLCAKGPRVGDQLPIHVDNCNKPVTVAVHNKGKIKMGNKKVFKNRVFLPEFKHF